MNTWRFILSLGSLGFWLFALSCSNNIEPQPEVTFQGLDTTVLNHFSADLDAKESLTFIRLIDGVILDTFTLDQIVKTTDTIVLGSNFIEGQPTVKVLREMRNWRYHNRENLKDLKITISSYTKLDVRFTSIIYNCSELYFRFDATQNTVGQVVNKIDTTLFQNQHFLNVWKWESKGYTSMNNNHIIGFAYGAEVPGAVMLHSVDDGPVLIKIDGSETWVLKSF